MEMSHQPYFVSERWDCTLSLVPEGIISSLLPRKKRIQRLRKQLEEDAESIALRNSGNIQWALKQNIEDTFRRFSEEITQRFEEAIQITRGAITAILKQRIEKARDIEPEKERVKVLELQLTQMQNQLSEIESELNISHG